MGRRRMSQRSGKARILVVDDEKRYTRAIQVNLMTSGYQVLAASDGRAAIEMSAAEEPDLIILDVKLPGMSGFEVCRRIREFSSVPIIMLTALAEEEDRVKGLDLGADDYVTKPFSAEELLARVRAVLRRVELSKRAGGSSVFQEGDLLVDFGQQRVFVGDQEVHLTRTEYRLLRELAQQAGRILTPEHLLQVVWGQGYEGDTHLVWQAVHRLRQKTEPDPKNPCFIETRSGLGYVLVRQR